MRRSILVISAVFILAFVLSGTAFASVYIFDYSSQTLSIRAPSVTLGAGNAGSSTISSVAADAATVTVLSAPYPPYVAITLVNSASSATGIGFQQEVTFVPSTYASYERSDLGNIRFCADSACGTLLYAWLESCVSPVSCTSSSTSAAAWVKLTSTIGGSGGTLTIYMGFLSRSTAFDGNYWGEASDLSTTYGQYDNGAKVFLYYNNGGTTTGFNVVNGGSLGVASMTDPYGVTTNVLALAGRGSTTTSSETVAWYTTGVAGNNFIIDGWVDILSTTDSATYNANALYAARGASSTTTRNYLLGEGWSNARSSLAYESGTTNTVLATSGTRSTGWAWSTSSLVGSTLTNGMYTAPSYAGGTSLATTTATNTNLGAANTYVGMANWAGAAGKSFFYQWKVRVYPPSRVMPSVSFGSVTRAYILAITNQASSSWNVNLAVASSSNTGRLTNLTMWFYSPTSVQIRIGTAVTQLTTGPVVTLPGSGTLYIALYASSSVSGSSTVTLSLKIQLESTGPYAQYTIYLTVN